MVDPTLPPLLCAPCTPLPSATPASADVAALTVPRPVRHFPRSQCPASGSTPPTDDAVATTPARAASPPAAHRDSTDLDDAPMPMTMPMSAPDPRAAVVPAPLPMPARGPSAARIPMSMPVSLCEADPVSGPSSCVSGPGRYLRSADRR